MARDNAALIPRSLASVTREQWRHYRQRSLLMCPSHQSWHLMKLAYRSTRPICAHASMTVVRCLWSKVALFSPEKSLAINSLSTKVYSASHSKSTKQLSRSLWSCMKRSARTSKWDHQHSDSKVVMFVRRKSSPSCKTWSLRIWCERWKSRVAPGRQHSISSWERKALSTFASRKALMNLISLKWQHLWSNT